MKDRKIMKRIGAIVCALFMCVSVFGSAMPYYAYENGVVTLEDVLEKYNINLNLDLSQYKGQNWVMIQDANSYEIIITNTDEIYFREHFGSAKSIRVYSKDFGDGHSVVKCVIKKNDLSVSVFDNIFESYFEYSNLCCFADKKIHEMQSSYIVNTAIPEITNNFILYSSCDIRACDYTINVRNSAWANLVLSANAVPIGDVVSSSGGSVSANIGYLQNINRSIVYPRGALYNYNEDKRTDRWTFDKITTTELDLSSGGYSIKYYVRPVVVEGYEDADLIEKGEKYYIDTYDASKGYIEYLYNDMDAKMREQGYEDLGFIDKYLRGYFVLEWHYFEIVNDETGESGGYVCLKPKDADPDNFGTEYEIIAVDEEDNLIEDYEKGVGYIGEGSYVSSEGETLEDAFERAEQNVTDQKEHVGFLKLEGLDSFTATLESSASSVGNVSDVVGEFFGCLPPWMLVVLGLSVGLGFVLFIIKVLRG